MAALRNEAGESSRYYTARIRDALKFLPREITRENWDNVREICDEIIGSASEIKEMLPDNTREDNGEDVH